MEQTVLTVDLYHTLKDLHILKVHGIKTIANPQAWSASFHAPNVT